MNKQPTEVSEERVIETLKTSEHALLNLIHERLGIIIHPHQTRDLYKTIVEACHKFQFLPEEYLSRLNNCSSHDPLIEHLIVGITVGETYFFRDKRQVDLLKDKILPTIIKSKKEQGNLSLRIWSAGCASGEEIYTVAMLLNEILPDKKAWSLNILGTDINTLSLQKAIKGYYGEWSMRSIDNYYKQKYFVHEESHYNLRPEIRDSVKFDYLNLNDEIYPSLFTNTNMQDLILCRNVLIYFDSERVGRLMHKLSASLIPGGYLLLGASDPVDFKPDDLIFHHNDGMLFSRPTLEPVEPVKESIKKINSKSFSLAESVEAEIEKINFFGQTKSVAINPKNTQSALENDITKLLREARWQEVLVVVSAYPSNEKLSPLVLNSKAIALANLGKLDQAVDTLQTSLSIDPTNKQSYFIYGLVMAELNQVEQAEKALRKTLFLDHEFVEGHYQLGLLLLKNKQKEAGLKCLQHALSIANRKDPLESIPEQNELSYGRFAEIVKHEIERSERNNHA
jgi:chemotaxis protein methyltransferase CheR